MARIIGLCLISITVYACTPIGPSTTTASGDTKVLRLEDWEYEKEIKTVRLSRRGSQLTPAVSPLGQSDLMLEFDDLAQERDVYNASIIHCNYNWTASNLLDLDYMREYNELPVNNSQFSADTHIPYVHYWFNIPNVKLPGNYVLIVYRGTDKQDLILSRRFMVHDNKVSFVNDGKMIGPSTIADVNQQLNFTVNHSNLNILNPMMDVHVNIRQNQRWDNYATDVKPSFIHDLQKEIEYHFFDEAKMFKGGNEFRFFDMRSLISPGRNVRSVDKRTKPYHIFIEPDKSRRTDVYSQYDEMNGNFLINNFDYPDPAYTNYAWVHFALASRPVEGDVFVAGAFNNWRLDKTNRMAYDSTKQAYTSEVLLKQGWYDYQYYVKSSKLSPLHFEGSFFQTENQYEIFVYYRPFQPQADLLIGYLRLEQNPH